MDDSLGDRLAKALESLGPAKAPPGPQGVSDHDAAVIYDRVIKPENSPFRRAEERKREYLAREDGSHLF